MLSIEYLMGGADISEAGSVSGGGMAAWVWVEWGLGWSMGGGVMLLVSLSQSTLLVGICVVRKCGVFTDANIVSGDGRTSSSGS